MKMLRDYLQLRRVGHSVQESLARAFDYHVITPIFGSIAPFFFGFRPEDVDEKLPEVQVEENLTSLEARVNTLDFQSLSDIAHLPTDTKPRRYTTDEEAILVYLHGCYISDCSSDKPFLSFPTNNPKDTKHS